jgi:hypothetical protein
MPASPLGGSSGGDCCAGLPTHAYAARVVRAAPAHAEALHRHVMFREHQRDATLHGPQLGRELGQFQTPLSEYP